VLAHIWYTWVPHGPDLGRHYIAVWECLVKFCSRISWNQHTPKDWFLGFKKWYRSTNV